MSKIERMSRERKREYECVFEKDCSQGSSSLTGEVAMQSNIYTRCTHKSLTMLLRDGPTEQYFAYEFNTTSVSAPDINLQVESVKQ